MHIHIYIYYVHPWKIAMKDKNHQKRGYQPTFKIWLTIKLDMECDYQTRVSHYGQSSCGCHDLRDLDPEADSMLKCIIQEKFNTYINSGIFVAGLHGSPYKSSRCDKVGRCPMVAQQRRPCPPLRSPAWVRRAVHASVESADLLKKSQEWELSIMIA